MNAATAHAVKAALEAIHRAAGDCLMDFDTLGDDATMADAEWYLSTVMDATKFVVAAHTLVDRTANRSDFIAAAMLFGLEPRSA
jgi:hypothetical protein